MTIKSKLIQNLALSQNEALIKLGFHLSTNRGIYVAWMWSNGDVCAICRKNNIPYVEAFDGLREIVYPLQQKVFGGKKSSSECNLVLLEYLNYMK